MAAYTDEQLEAIMQAKERDPALGKLKAGQIAAQLQAQGHPLFASGGSAAKAGAAGAPAKAATAPTQVRPTTKPAPAPEDRDDTRDEPVTLDTAPVDAGPRRTAPAAAPQAAQAPARVAAEPSRPQLPARAAGVSTAVEGMEVTPGDLQLPSLKLKQEQTEIDDDAAGDVQVENGNWFVDVDPAINGQELLVCFVANKLGRALWLPRAATAAGAVRARISDYAPGVELPDDLQGPACSSEDRRAPTPTEWGVLCESCDRCELAKWRTVSGSRVQDCGETYTFLGALLEHGELPVIYRAHRTQISPVKGLLTNLALAGRRCPDMAAWQVRLTSKRVKGQQGYYYVPVFGRPELIQDAALVESLRALRAACWGGRAAAPAGAA